MTTPRQHWLLHSSALSAALLLSALVACPVMAAPFEVSSAHVGTHTTFQTEARWAHAPGQHSLTLPKLKLEAPVIPHRLEFKVSDSYKNLHRRDEPPTQGWSDLELEAKLALASQGADSPVDVAIEPKWQLATGDERRGLGEGAARVALPVMVARRFGRAQVTAEVEYKHGMADVPDTLDGGVLGLWQVQPDFIVGAEIYAAHDLVENAQLDMDANVGFKWQAATHWQFDALAGHSLRRAEEHVKLVAEYAF